MGIDIQRDILGLKGQRVNEIKLDKEKQQLIIYCRRDRRRNAIDPVTGLKPYPAPVETEEGIVLIDHKASPRARADWLADLGYD